ncbi:MAG: glutamine synthetase [Rhizobiales bacterium]|nr:glutamine synthetase [Hyphomicrobiales bacterium]MBI3673689.1 glutamine synthetase [Hyphomicrobiales bacterium]
MKKANSLDWLKGQTDIRSLRAAVCDLNGVMRGKRIPVEQVEKVLAGGLRMPLSVVGVDIWGEDIVNSPLVFATGDADGLCEPIGRGILPMDWTAEPTALIPLWLREENGSPFGGDPRQALAGVANRFRDLGLRPVVAMELEFYLYDPTERRPVAPVSPVTGKRLDADAVLSIDELDDFGAFFGDVYAACALQGVPADSAIAENGIGQFEINLMHVNDPLRAADDAVLFKRIVKGVARKHGFAASFMAKPYGGRSGSGLHVHFSLLDRKGKNVFDNGGPEGSDTLRHAVAGLMEAMAETTLLFAPHFNSYRRLRPGTHAPSAAAWGYENRTVAMRIPGGPPKARRIEHRVAGADANPYLVLAGILAGALVGIERRMTPPDPVTGDAYALKLKGLPPDWASAINAFAAGAIVEATLPLMLRDMLVACKRQEMATFAGQVTDFEYETYLDMV